MAEEDLKRLIESSAAETRKQFESLDKKIDAVAGALDKKIDAVAGALDKKIDAVAGTLDKKIDAVAGALDKKIGTLDQKVDDIRRHIDVFGERLESKIQLVGESVADVKAKLALKADRDEMLHGFAETQAMIKFSYSDLDRRLRSLEGTVSGLESRVERLEGSNRPS